jgi:TM2 domain-containing membrane protein YozV
MSDIPLTAGPGWYNDPTGLLRWWDGAKWGPYAPHPAPGQNFVQPIPGQKETGIAYLMLLLLGGFGAHHFYLGNVYSGVILLVLWWGGWATSFIGIGYLLILAVLIWFIIDLFLLPSYVRAANMRRLVT